MKLQLLFLFAINAVLASYKSYDGYQLLRTVALNETSIQRLVPLLQRHEFDFWTMPRVGRTLDVMTSPEHVHELHEALSDLGMNPSVIESDIGQLIRKEREQIETTKENIKAKNTRAPSFDTFLDFDEIQSYLEEVVATYPNIASLINIGTSYEGRPLRVLKVSSGPGKPGMFFDSVIHAREWAGPPVALYAINELTENLAMNQATLDLADFYFLPVANPDGYVYTWNTNRLWRKTRRPNEGSSCIGTDPNRNFDWQWAEGGVNDPCDETYPGSGALSESEVAAISNFILNTPNIQLYLAFHSFGQSLIFPWGGLPEKIPNFDEVMQVGTAAAEALSAIRGTAYIVMQIYQGGGFTYSTSTDWAYGGAKIPFSYTIELPPGGSSGFELPATEILPVATETWEALKSFAVTIQRAASTMII